MKVGAGEAPSLLVGISFSALHESDCDVLDGARSRHRGAIGWFVGDESHERSRPHAYYDDRFRYSQERVPGSRDRHDREGRRQKATPPRPGDEVFRSSGAVPYRHGSLCHGTPYQQAPVPPGGAMIRREWLRYYDKTPERTYQTKLIQSWDTADKERRSCSRSARSVTRQLERRWHHRDEVHDLLDHGCPLWVTSRHLVLRK